MKKLGIKQPYFLPYIGYFAQINYVDHYIFFDTPQYERRGWMNRNRILNPDKDFTYINVPIKKSPQNTPICEIMTDRDQDWCRKILSQMVIYKKTAPYYNETIDFLSQILSSEYDSLSKLNIETTKQICYRLGITTTFEVFSEMNLEYEDVTAKDEWALNITKALRFDNYVESPGAMEYFDRSKFENNNIKLDFFKAEIHPYVQRIGRFVGGLSIVDVMMFNSIDEIRQMMNQFTLL